MSAPTNDEIINRLKTDSRYFVERCLSIVDQGNDARGPSRVPFILNACQAKFYENRTQRDEIVKSRKMGFSALIGAVFLHSCATVPNTRAVVVSHEKEATQRLLGRVRDYIKNCALPVRIGQDSEGSITFPDTNSSYWIGTAGARSFGRGDDITHLHLSEKAHYAHPEMLAGVEEAMVKGSVNWIVSETTAKGAGTDHHRAWLRAVRGQSSYKAHFFAWWEDPLNFISNSMPFELDDEEKKLKSVFDLSWGQLAWRKKKRSDMTNPELFVQEYPATWEEAFLSAGAMAFDWAAVKRLDDTRLPAKWTGNIVDKGNEIDVVSDPRGPLKIYRSPEARVKRYLIVSDTADGVDGGAYSVADVFDPKTWEQVAQWRGHADPVSFAAILARLGAFYGWALIAVENNYPGNSVLGQLSSMGYPNLYAEDSDLGWKTTMQSKSEFISDGRASVKDGSLKINSEDTIQEYRTFCLAENGRMEAQSGCFSDTIITSCKAANILKKWHFEPEEERQSFRDVLGFQKRRGLWRGGSGGGSGRVV